jgi:hypothetical protein
MRRSLEEGLNLRGGGGSDGQMKLEVLGKVSKDSG